MVFLHIALHMLNKEKLLADNWQPALGVHASDLVLNKTFQATFWAAMGQGSNQRPSIGVA